MRKLTKEGRTIALGILLGLLIFVVGVVILFRPTIGPFHDSAIERPCVKSVYEDANGNGKIDSGEGEAANIPIEIVVDDENGFTNSGRFSKDKCILTAGRENRVVRLSFILPPEYKMTAALQNGVYSTSTDVVVSILETTHFVDYPPDVKLLVQHISPAPSTP